MAGATRRTGRLVAALAAIAVVAATGCAGDGTASPSNDEVVPSTGTSEPPADGTDPDPDPSGTRVEPRPSAGCDGGELGATELEEVGVDDTGRSFLLSAPAGEADDPRPLVVALHGLMEGSRIHAAHSGLGDLGRGEGFVTAFPEGTGDPVRWSTEPTADNPDLAYLDQVIDSVLALRCIDEARIYATGLSNGAMMTSTLACVRSERFAAVAPVDGISDVEPCEPARAVPVVTTHGTLDPILLFNGGIGDLSFLGVEQDGPPTTLPPADLDGPGHPATVAGWAERNGCAPGPSDERIGEMVLHRVYECPDDAAVEFYVVEGGGHTWPGSEFSRSIEQIVGPTTFEIDWNEVAWEFFSRHALG